MKTTKLTSFKPLQNEVIRLRNENAELLEENENIKAWKTKTEFKLNELLILNAELLESLQWALNNLNNYDTPSDENINIYNKAIETIKKATI